MGGFFGEKPKRYACSVIRRLCVRRPGHYCCARGLRLSRRQADAPAARNCQRTAWPESIRWRTRNGAAWPSLSLLHRLWCGYGLLCGEPRHSSFDTVCRRFWRAVWRGRLLLHEPRCAAALRCRQASVFFKVDDHRRGHTYLLRGTSHIPRRAAIFKMMGSPLVGGSFSEIQFPQTKIVFERSASRTLLSYAA